MYVSINKVGFLRFKGCGGCIDCCKKPMAPLVLEDFKKVYKYFPILIAKLDIYKPVMLLSNENSCPYLSEEKCTIYEQRPPACRIYPFSPWYDDVLIDVSCKGVGIDGESLPLSKKELSKSRFYDERMENISEKIEKTSIWLQQEKLKPYKTYMGIKLFTLEKNENRYNVLHQKSLINIKNYMSEL